MWQVIEKEIERKARKILEKHRRELANDRDHAKRFAKRTGLASGPATTKPPAHWALHKHFDPIYCIKHCRFIARSIWRKIENSQYTPLPAIMFEIEKPDGGTRQIMSFSIPDASVANIFHRRLTNRNKGLFSAYSFAYRPDKNIFEGIIQLRRMLQPPKTFVLKYDYSKYFDTIDHDYLKKFISNGAFVITSAERHVIDAFLKHRYSSFPSYGVGNHQQRMKGVPQGSSLSLFLSNIAAHELDMKLEQLNGSFVRFADDVIAVAHSFEDAREIELEFRAHCERSGVKINFEKSSGISLLHRRKSDDRRDYFLDGSDGGRLALIDSVDFLGHNVSSDQITLTKKAIKRIKRRISKAVYIHLLLYPRRGNPINPDRIGGNWVDWDLITALNEVRRYVYGGLSETDLENFIEHDVKLRAMKGLMAFYPLVDTVRELQALDGWLVSMVLRAVRERNRLIVAAGMSGSYKLSEKSLIAGSWYGGELNLESRIPSFVRAWRSARKFYKRYGLGEVGSPSYYSLISLYS